MSKATFVKGDFVVVAGVDHVTSSFIQVWDMRNGAIDSHDGADVVVDNQGVRYGGDEQEDDPAKRYQVPELTFCLKSLEERFKLSRSRGNPYPNLGAEDAAGIMRCLGWTENIDIILYQIFDASASTSDAEMMALVDAD